MTLVSTPQAESIAIVTPRYGDDVIGGAEDVLADLARGLVERGHPVEILTTCARDHYRWVNVYRPGSSVENGIVVRRFRAEVTTSGRDRERIGGRILAGENITIQDQQLWMNDDFRSSGLWHHVFDHGASYRAIIAGPYHAWTTYAVAQIHPRKTMVMPCLHDEPQARLDVMAALLEGAGGILFLTEPEQELAERLYRLGDRKVVMGASVDVPSTYDPDAFRREYEIDDDYIYFAGRREWGKGWNDLLNAYSLYLQQRAGGRSLRLVTSGVGPVEPPLGTERHIIDVGLLSPQQRDNAMAGATAYVQPSAMESFSRTVLEAMAAGTPVVANGRGDVVAWHLDRSGAGVTYRTRSELIESLHFVTDESVTAAALAAGGRSYVLDNYRIEPVVDRLEAALDQWLPAGVMA